MARARNTGQVPWVESLGLVRRSQLVSTYGIGSIIDLEAGSFMPTGLEDWDQATRFPSLWIHEPRLQAQLGVDHFRAAPVAEPIPNAPGHVDARKTTPAIRFPEWHECPTCHRLGVEAAPFEADGNKLKCLACRVQVNPVRFVVACRRGHIQDFPWSWWAHRNVDKMCDRPTLRLTSLGTSAALADLLVECIACKGARSSLGDAFSPKVFDRVGCSGQRPWLHDHEACAEVPRAIQRGASNVHFAVVASALSIPPASQPAFQLLEELEATLKHVPEEIRLAVLDGYAREHGFSEDELRAAYLSNQGLGTREGLYTDAVSRSEEFRALCNETEDQAQGGLVPQFANRLVATPGLMPWFDLVGAVSRLREVRALAGFSRIEPYPVSGERIHDAIRDGHLSPVSNRQHPTWLPGAEIRGEGVFLRFHNKAVDSWISDNPDVVGRASRLQGIADAVAQRRGWRRDYVITPRLLLVHSFAHCLIRQLSLDCGYSASSLRERLYVAEASEDGPAMNAILVYTGSPDSDGSLGGLVRIAENGMLEQVVKRAVTAAEWCGSDPVCLETDPGQSGERISGAACHCCLLLPETACEKFNRELDRTMLVGAPDLEWNGFFKSFGQGA